MGLQLGHVEYIMYTSKPTLQIQLIGTLTNTLKDFEWSHKALVQLPDSRQMKVTYTQQQPSPQQHAPIACGGDHKTFFGTLSPSLGDP